MDSRASPAEPRYRAAVAELVAAVTGAVPDVEVSVHHHPHSFWRAHEAVRWVSPLVREFPAGHPDYRWFDEAGAPVIQLGDATALFDWIEVDVEVFEPFLEHELADLEVELVGELRRRHPEIDDVGVELRQRRGHRPVAGDYPHDVWWLGLHVRAFLEVARASPRRPAVDSALIAMLPFLPPELHAVIHTLALHDAGDCFDGRFVVGDALDAMREWSGGPFPIAYDYEDERTCAISAGSDRAVACWVHGLKTSAELRYLDDETDVFRHCLTSLEDALRTGLDSTAGPFFEGIERVRERAAPVLSNQRARDNERGRRLAERGYVGVVRGRSIEPPPLPWRLSGDPRDVVFVRDGNRERVFLVAPDGERVEVDLPSPTYYRQRAALTVDRSRLLVASATRLRQVDLATGEVRIVMEGPAMTQVACLAGDLVVFASRGGEVSLDLSDPDVAELASVKHLAPQGQTARMIATSGLGLCKLGERPELIGWIDCDDITGLTAVLDGRALVIQSVCHWRAMVLAVADDKLAPLRKLAHGGVVFEDDGRVFGEWGFELIGIEAAMDSIRPFLPASIARGMRLETPALPARTLTGEDQSIWLELVDGPPEAPPSTSAAGPVCALSRSTSRAASSSSCRAPQARGRSSRAGRWTASISSTRCRAASWCCRSGSCLERSVGRRCWR